MSRPASFNETRRILRGVLRPKRKKKLANLEKRVRRIEKGVEKSWIDNAATVVLTATPQKVLLNGIVQGDDHSQREGSKIAMKTNTLRFILNRAGATIETNVRVMIVLDKEPHGLVYADPSFFTNAGPTYTTLEYYNLETTGRYKILYDKVHKVDPNNGPVVSRKQVTVKVNMNAQYNGNTGSFADVTKNALWLVYYADAPTAGVFPQIFYSNRLRYTDN